VRGGDTGSVFVMAAVVIGLDVEQLLGLLRQAYRGVEPSDVCAELLAGCCGGDDDEPGECF
jgi:hypothetical protein